jgi:hypothetical protein
MRSSLIHRMWYLACLPAAHRFEAALADPGGCQRRRLAWLLKRHRSSAFGHTHGFASITGADDYRRRVPVQRWEDIAPWVERIRAGEREVLTCDVVSRLVPTSGSTAGRKLIPWNAGLARDFHAALAPWIVDLQRIYPRISGGPAYWSISPGGESTESGKVPIGFDDDSAYLGGLLAAWVRPLFAAPRSLRGIRDGEAFRYATVRCLLARPQLRMISVWHPSFLSLLLDCAVAHRTRLLGDLAHGGISVDLPAPARAPLEPWLRPLPRRAAELAAVDWSDPSVLWPALALVSCWSDAAAALPAAALRNRLRSVPLQGKGLLATEGVVSVPWQGRQVAAVTSHVLEFLDADGRLRWIDELEVGGTYEVVLTTSGGLWRYRLGDRVRVDGRCQATPCLSFIGRAGAQCDLVGEKLEEGFVAACCATAVPQAGFALLGPNADGSAGYTLFTDVVIDPKSLGHLERTLDGNPHWQLARRLGQLAPIRCMLVGPEAARIWMEHRHGAALGAVKPSTLTADRGWAQRFSGARQEAACFS